MNKCHYLFALWSLAALSTPAPAGLIFNRQPKPNPAERVPALIAILRADPDEHKRSKAIEELRQFDATAFPQIVPTLCDIAQHDASSSVRLDALQSLEKIRPVSQRAGWVLEQAMANDSSKWVRLQARTLLWQYHLGGFHGSKDGEPAPVENGIHTEEPPLAPPIEPPVRPGYAKPAAPSMQVSPPVRLVPVPTSRETSRFVPATPARPLPPQPAAIPVGPRPLPSGPVQSGVPQALPQAPKPPAPEEGPELTSQE